MKGIKKGCWQAWCCVACLFYRRVLLKETLGVLWNSEDKSPDGEVQDTQEDISGLKWMRM